MDLVRDSEQTLKILGDALAALDEPESDGCPVHRVPQPEDCAPCREAAEPCEPSMVLDV